MAVLERDPSRFADSGVSGRPESARRGRAAAHGAAGTPPPAGGNIEIWTIYPWPIPRWSMGGVRPKPPIKMHWPNPTALILARYSHGTAVPEYGRTYVGT